MKTRLAKLAACLWYGNGAGARLLLPLSKVFEWIVYWRRLCYQNGWLHSETLPVPLVVIGNITVGGTGKTPLVIFIAGLLQRQGYRPGIVSRGYGGRAEHGPLRVTPESDVHLVGDEALLMATKTGCPVAVAKRRSSACRLLLSEMSCDVLLSDDGLQHYALGRTLEIAVIDGVRRFGNGYCLPAGPLREPLARLKQVDMIVVNGGEAGPGEYRMQLVGQDAVNLQTGERRPLASFRSGECHAVAGIGHPARFFQGLADAGLHCNIHEFPDHYWFRPEDLEFGDDLPVLITEKDAVKCNGFALAKHWTVPVEPKLDDGFAADLLELIKKDDDR